MLPDIRPGNTKILYFFNCLLDGMHTKTDYICDFSRGRLNVRLYARIQPLLRGHKYSLFSLFEDCGLAGANALLYEIVIKFVKKIDYFLCENYSHIKMLTFPRWL